MNFFSLPPLAPQMSRHQSRLLRAGCRLLSQPGSLLIAMLLLAGGTVLSLPTSAADIPSISGGLSEILDPTEAFQPVILSVNKNELEIEFTIAPDYYLYRKKMALLSDDPLLQITNTNLPPGLEIEDEFFGKTQIYRDQASLNTQFSLTPNTNIQDRAEVQQAQVTLQYQGCADVGICYPPQEKVLTLNIPLSESAATLFSSDAPQQSNLGQSDAGEQISDKLDSLLVNTDTPLLPAEIAFVPSIGAQSGVNLPIQFSIKEGYYLYKDKIDAKLLDAEGAEVLSISLPAGKEKDDAYFGLVEIYRYNAKAMLTLANLTQTNTAALSIDYQGCADIGVCYPPQTSVIPLSLKSTRPKSESGSQSGPESALKSEQRPAENTTHTQTETTLAPNTESRQLAVDLQQPAALLANPGTKPTASEQDRLAEALSTHSIWLIIATFFGLGLLLAFTPCVFPMVPILSSLIVGQGESLTTKKAFALSLTYVLAMALTYTIAGVIVGLSGENIQVWFQNPWVLSVFALIFVLLSLSMFGFYELEMPQAVQQRLNNLSNKAEGGTYIGAGIMGFLSALIVGPCVTAPLVGALIFIANTGDALVGGTALFALSMGMGAPLLLIGASCGKLLPKSGAWMNVTKAVFGVLLLAVAIWLLERILPAAVTLVLAAALVIVSGIYLGATDSLSQNVSGWRKLAKGLGIVMLIYGMALLVGALSGGHSLLQPLGKLAASNTRGGEPVQSEALEFKRIYSVAELEQVVAQAAQNNQTVMLDFYADWCISCKEMEAFTFTDSAVQERLSKTVLIQADVTANNDDDKQLLKRFGLFGPPGIIFYDTGGSEIPAARMVGFMNAEKFSAHLDRFLETRLLGTASSVYWKPIS